MATGERLRLAREALGLDQEALASRVGISADALAGYEGDAPSPEPEVLWNLAQEMGLGLGFFLRELPVTPIEAAHDGLHELGEDAQAAAMAQTRIWLESAFDLESFFDVEEFTLFAPPAGFPRSGASPREAAQAAEALRDAWELAALPLPSLVDLLDNAGIRIAMIDGADGFDAAALRSADQLALPIIAVRRDLPGDAQRYAVVRELAYFVLDEATPQTAGHFAGAFLIPTRALQLELGMHRQNLELFELQLIKQKYGISMRRALVRAAAVRIIERDTLDNWMSIFQDNGWNTAEPGDNYPAETASRLFRLAMRLQAEGEIEPDSAADILGLSPEDWDDIVNFRVEALEAQPADS